jgi:ABC-2 type transport system ATP-binding protein
VPDPVVVVENLRKRYGDFEAVRGIDFTIERGELVAFLGPNGAGKTTTVEILEGYRRPTAGRVEVLGFDPAASAPEFRQRVGIVLQEAGLLPYLTAGEMVDGWRRMYRNSLGTAQALAQVGLTDRADVLTKDLSGGEKRGHHLGLGTIGRPQQRLRDEPTTGFDPSARRQAWELIRGLVGAGTTVFLTTHYLDEAQELADRVIVIAKGLIVAEGSIEDLRGAHGDAAHIRFTLPDGCSARDLPPFGPLTDVLVGDRYVEIVTQGVTRALHILTAWALERGIELDTLSVERPSLEDMYLRIVGEEVGLDVPPVPGLDAPERATA